ncbi:hypothetical protein LTR37_000448 [Vermiconidia calcicola]|uniref:Uncharacterized protein n=1 Tax=Vermiconidia calcicola TaxID=1690605 RepID=A0ACC3NZ03_9PEZI|nr:hypothetical protein LTR37_000448 [Vermiconidia calcicola]
MSRLRQEDGKKINTLHGQVTELKQQVEDGRRKHEALPLEMLKLKGELAKLKEENASLTGLNMTLTGEKIELESALSQDCSRKVELADEIRSLQIERNAARGQLVKDQRLVAAARNLAGLTRPGFANALHELNAAEEEATK